MPGIINNNMAGAIIAHPQNFNPRDLDQWEWIVGDEAPDEDTMSTDQGVATMSGYFYPDHAFLWDAVAFMVGYSKVNFNNQFKLDRWLPAVHPRWPMMRCTTVSVKGVEFDGTVDPIEPRPLRYLTLPKYERYRFDCHFEQPQFNYLDNGQCDTEWERYLTVDPTDESEFVVVDGGRFIYSAPNQNFDGTPFNGPAWRVRVERSGLMVTAYGIPADFIMNTFSIPVHFLAAKNKVNSTDFLGLPAGTMLLQDYKITKRAQPIATNSVNALLFGCTVEMHFGYTDPARGHTGSSLRGWNLFPPPAGYNSANWWPAQTHSDFGSKSQYDVYDHNKLLQHWNT